MNRCAIARILAVLGVMLVGSSAAGEALAQARTRFGGRGPLSQSSSLNRASESLRQRSGGQSTGSSSQLGGGSDSRRSGPLSQMLNQLGFPGRSNRDDRLTGGRRERGRRQDSRLGPGSSLDRTRGPDRSRSRTSLRNQSLNQRDRSSRGSQRRTIRPRQKVAFSYPRRNVQRLATKLQSRFRFAAKRYPSMADVTFRIDGDRIMLDGSVASDQARALATLLAKMEPGVRSVENRLTVKSGSATESEDGGP